MADDKRKKRPAREQEESRIREELQQEVRELREKYANATQYIRRKVNQLLTVMGTAQLRPEELDDATLIELDPIGIVSDSFLQILRNVKETNEQLRTAHDEITAIFDSAGMGILVLDRDMRVIAWNKKIEDQFQFDRSAARGGFATNCSATLNTAKTARAGRPSKRAGAASRTWTWTGAIIIWWPRPSRTRPAPYRGSCWCTWT